MSSANYKGAAVPAQFEADGGLKNPAMTFFACRGGKQVPLN